MQMKWKNAMELVRPKPFQLVVISLFWKLLDFYMVILSCQYLFIQAKQSTGGSGVDAANVMISQLRAQKAVKKKSSTAAPPTPGRVSEIYDPVL